MMQHPNQGVPVLYQALLCLIHHQHVVQIDHNPNPYTKIAIMGFIIFVKMRGPDACQKGAFCIVTTSPSN